MPPCTAPGVGLKRLFTATNVRFVIAPQAISTMVEPNLQRWPGGWDLA
ncbi:MAG: hypothetical protein HQ482_06045 [Sphingomonadales bacterium]|nr:hypothetical protein [Sphingomonadales bacterium]